MLTLTRSLAERAKLVARKRRKDPNKDRKGKPINVSNKLNSGGFVKLNNPGKADLNKDGSLSSYEKKRGMAIERSMAKQNKLQMKNGGFVAKGCGNIMPNRKKVTTIS